MTDPIKILIAEDHRLFREGLVNLLGESPEIDVIDQAEDGMEVINKVEALMPDIILMDISMPGLNGIEATSILKKKYPGIKIIILSMHSEQSYVEQALKEGAMGYLIKDSTYDQLIHAIRIVYSGGKFLSNEITETLISDYLYKKKHIPISNSDLSERQVEVLQLIADGTSTREISEMLFISMKTVGTHKQKILEKLNFKTNADLVKYALRHGLTTL
jgi:DNA-binding NarL/FixJ family response regulator